MRRGVLIVCLCVLAFSGCAVPGDNEVSSGDVLIPEEQQSLYQARLEQEGEQNVSVKGTVYWTPNGTKYHKDARCSSLKNAKEVLSGTIAQATNHGADEPCLRCTGG